jgi:hypothetical protein
MIAFVFDQFELGETEICCTNDRTGVKYHILRRFKNWQGCQDFFVAGYRCIVIFSYQNFLPCVVN